MHNYPSVAIVILNWNGKFHLESFLPSVYNSTYPNLEFVIGDNASTDDSIDFIENNFPLIRIIRNDANYGFAEGYNRVLEQVEADYFILLNSDVEVTNNWIEPIIAAMESDPEVAAAQPKIRSWSLKDSFEYAGAAGGFIDRYGYPFCRGRLFNHVERDIGQYNDSKEIFWATGAALFIRSDRWKEIGGFDSDFFAHMEEIDLCWRLKRRGHKIWYYSDSEVYHVGGGTLDKSNAQKTFLNFRNNLFMILKNARYPNCTIFIRLWLDLIALLRFASSGKFADAGAVSRAHIDLFRNYRRMIKKRNAFTAPFLTSKVYDGLIIWDFFVKNKRRFGDLREDKFS